jgi:hypothetical protein
MSTKAVEKQQTGGLAQPGDTWLELRKLAEIVPVADDDENVGEIIAARILQSETLDQLLTPSAAPSMGQLVDKPIVVHDLRKRLGGMNKDLGFYLLVAVETMDNGVQEVYSTGAANVVTQLLAANARGWLPMKCKVLETESKSNPGQFIHWLVKLDNF